MASQQPHEEEPFWVFTQLMNSYGACCLFAETMPLLKLLMFQFQSLLHKNMPDLSAHLQNIGIIPELYAPQWMLTLFTLHQALCFVLYIYEIQI